MINKGDIFNRMISISNYFEKNAANNISFQPEAKASKTINKLIETLQELRKDDIQRMVDIINNVENIQHYNGSGWMDYKMHFLCLLRQNGFDVEWEHISKMKMN